MIAGLIFLVIISFAACSPSVVVKSPTSVGSPGTTVGQVGPTLMKEYVIQPGDQLDVKFFYNPDLNESITVRPDGRISLQLVGETIAAGRTPRALTELLTEEYDKELKQPEITVIVRSFGARVYVDGEVEKPGELELTGPLTVMQAISRSEGATEDAWDEALVIRRIHGRQPLVIPVDLSLVLAGEDFSQDIGLVPFDIVYVPRSPIADVNLWVDHYIRQNIPINFGAFFPLR